MARTLGSLILPDGTVWTDQHNWQNVRKNFRRTVGGQTVGYAQQTYRGQPITLNFDNGWLTNQQRLDILALASDPNLSTSFIWDNFTATITFNDPPHTITPLWNYFDPNDDFFQGELNLITI